MTQITFDQIKTGDVKPIDIGTLLNNSKRGGHLSYQFNPKWADANGHQTGRFDIHLDVLDWTGQHNKHYTWHCMKDTMFEFAWNILGKEGNFQQFHFVGHFISPNGQALPVFDVTQIAVGGLPPVPTPPTPTPPSPK